MQNSENTSDVDMITNTFNTFEIGVQRGNITDNFFFFPK